MFGLTEEAMLKMMRKNINRASGGDIGPGYLYDVLIPNIVEVIAANNEVLLSHLETERTQEDTGKSY
ncbi:hypothetical protein ACFLVN_04040 [Chloroflexota bacterium]